MFEEIPENQNQLSLALFARNNFTPVGRRSTCICKSGVLMIRGE